jgi:hypothetical protein
VRVGWIAILRKMDANIASTDADRIVRGTQSIAEGLDAQDTKALTTYYDEATNRRPKP